MSALVERVEGLAARALAAAPDGVVRRLAGRPIVIEGQTLDPHVQVAVRLENLSGGFKAAPVDEVRAKRRGDARAFAGRRIEVARVSAVEVPGPAGPIGARLYAPAGVAQPAPLVVYYHGGGHVICDLDTHDQPCRFLAAEIPALVLSVDYRLGPEHRFPAAVDDSLAAFDWAHAEAERLGADPERIAVAGDSAGANLATVVAQQTAAGSRPAPVFQALIYPVIDYSRKRASYETYAEGFFLTAAEMDWFRDHYFASADDRADPRASPILARAHRGRARARRHRGVRPVARRGRGLRRRPARGRMSRSPSAASPTSSTGSSTRSASAAARARRWTGSRPRSARGSATD